MIELKDKYKDKRKMYFMKQDSIRGFKEIKKDGINNPKDSNFNKKSDCIISKCSLIIKETIMGTSFKI